MKIVVLVKYVPEPTAKWRFADDLTLERSTVEGRLSELDEYAVEQAVRLLESGSATELQYLTVGPAKAIDGLRKALAMGGDSGVHVSDDAIHGSDSLSTSLVLATALKRMGFDLIMTGMASTDAEMSVVPSMVADRLGVAQATFAGDLQVAGATVTARRDGDSASEEIEVSLPALVSVTDQIGDPRYPAFKALMAGKKKPVATWNLAELGLGPDQVGWAAAAVAVHSIEPKPRREAGTVITDDGTAAAQLAEFLVARGLV